MKNLNKNQAGIAHLGLIIVGVLVIGVISFTAGRVYDANQKQEYAARVAEQQAQEKLKQELLTETKAEEEKVEVSEPKTEAAPVAEPSKTTTKTTEKTTYPTVTKVTISSTSSSVGADSVVLTAVLPGTYSGKCMATVKLTSGESEKWFEEAFSSASSCSVTVPREKLTAGSEWKYYMYFVNSESTVKGTSSSNTFSLL